jgi:hypothetical protein
VSVLGRRFTSRHRSSGDGTIVSTARVSAWATAHQSLHRTLPHNRSLPHGIDAWTTARQSSHRHRSGTCQCLGDGLPVATRLRRSFQGCLYSRVNAWATVYQSPRKGSIGSSASVCQCLGDGSPVATAGALQVLFCLLVSMLGRRFTSRHQLWTGCQPGEAWCQCLGDGLPVATRSRRDRPGRSRWCQCLGDGLPVATANRFACRCTEVTYQCSGDGLPVATDFAACRGRGVNAWATAYQSPQVSLVDLPQVWQFVSVLGRRFTSRH